MYQISMVTMEQGMSCYHPQTNCHKLFHILLVVLHTMLPFFDKCGERRIQEA